MRADDTYERRANKCCAVVCSFSLLICWIAVVNSSAAEDHRTFDTFLRTADYVANCKVGASLGKKRKEWIQVEAFINRSRDLTFPVPGIFEPWLEQFNSGESALLVVQRNREATHFLVYRIESNSVWVRSDKQFLDATIPLADLRAALRAP
jgi:hypothetical protein